MKNSCVYVWVSVLLFSTAVSSLAEDLQVPLRVKEPVGAARRGEVVSGGIPLPRGVFKDDARFSLQLGGTTVPVQVSPIVKYPDGSLHWVLVSFPVTVAARGEVKGVLRSGSAAATPSHAVRVKEQGDLVEVSNGIVAFAVNRKSFRGFEWISYKGRRVFEQSSPGMTIEGKKVACPVTHFEYVYRGPVRTTIYMKGSYGDRKAPTWSLSLTLCAGEPRIHLNHHLRNGGKGAKNIDVASPVFSLGTKMTLKEKERKIAPVRRRGKPAWGWYSFSGDPEVLVFLRYGGRGAPAYKVDCKDGVLTIHMGMGESDTVPLAYGAHKRTEIDIVFGRWLSPEALAEPLHALAPSAWYARYDGMGVGYGFGSLEDETTMYKTLGWKKADDPRKMPHERPNPNIYHSWFDAHRTSECDQLRGLTLGYVRSGQRGFLDRAHAWARYWETFLLYRSDEWIYGKEGRYRTPKWGRGRVCTEGCHNYAVGLFNYALLTGDVEALEAAFDGAEFANTGWWGQFSGKKPGQRFAMWGNRPFARTYVIVARAYDVARNRFWESALKYFVAMYTKTPERDPRGFIANGRPWASSLLGRCKRKYPDVLEIIEKEGVKVQKRVVLHPKYGTYAPKCVGTWPESIASMANYWAWQLLRDSKDPEARLLAEDAKDMAIAEAYLGYKYAYNRQQKAVYYYMYLDFPIPDFCPLWYSKSGKKFRTDSWYTKWWPDVLARGYLLTGDERLKKLSAEVLWWGLSRVYVGKPRVPEGEAPPYAWVSTNTKGDWISPTAVTFGVWAHPRKDTQPPAAVSDLKATALGGGKVELTWTAPADRGGGKVVYYQVKYALKPIKDYLDVNYREERNTVCYWNMAKNVLGEPKPGAPGAKEKMVLEGLPSGKKLYFALRSEDGAANRSAVSNVAVIDVK